MNSFQFKATTKMALNFIYEELTTDSIASSMKSKIIQVI